jgi:hypothetical protein
MAMAGIYELSRFTKLMYDKRHPLMMSNGTYPPGKHRYNAPFEMT